MENEKEVFIKHVFSMVERELEKHAGIIAAVEFSSVTYQGILMYLQDILEQGKRNKIILTEEVIPRSLIVFKI